MQAITQSHFEYINYLAQFNKEVSNADDFNFRHAIFQAVNAYIISHNNTESSYKLGHNQFSDWTHEEYRTLLGLREGLQQENVVVFNAENTPESVNWVTAGAVTGVKNQGSCGSCWAFSSTGSIEGAHFVATGELLSFSEQQLVDCATLRYGNLGCNGGLQTGAYNYYKNHAAELESVYPYTSGNGDDSTNCLADSLSATAVEVSSYVNVTPSNKTQMKAALDKQPLAVAIEADKFVFQTYQSGVLTSSKCGTNLDHAVLAVGYGTEDGQDYWLVKNSWDTTWGDQGYIKLGMDDSDGTCGVQIDPQAPSTN